MTRAKLTLLTIAIFAMLAAGFLAIQQEMTQGPGYDFFIFYAAGAVARTGANMYSAPLEYATGALAFHHGSYIFPYLPWVGWIFAPISLLPRFVALTTWDLILFTLLTGCSYLWARACSIRFPAVVAVLVSTSAVAMHNYGMGQTPILTVALLVGALISAQKRHLAWAGAFAVAATLTKFQDVWMLAPLALLLASNRRELVGIVKGEMAAGVVLIGLPMIVRPTITLDWVHFMEHFVRLPNPGFSAGISFVSALSGLVPQFEHLAGIVTLIGLALAVKLAHKVWQSRDQMEWERRVSWTLLLPITVWMLFTPYANVFDIIIAMPFLLFLVSSPKSVIRETRAHLLLAVAIVISTIQDLIIVRIYVYYDINAIVLLALVAVGITALQRELRLSQSASEPAQKSFVCKNNVVMEETTPKVRIAAQTQRGQSMMEYAIIVALVGVFVVVILALTGHILGHKYKCVANDLQNQPVACAAYVPPPPPCTAVCLVATPGSPGGGVPVDFQMSDAAFNTNYMLYSSSTQNGTYAYTGGYCDTSSTSGSCDFGSVKAPIGGGTEYYEAQGGGKTSPVVTVTWPGPTIAVNNTNPSGGTGVEFTISGIPAGVSYQLYDSTSPTSGFTYTGG